MKTILVIACVILSIPSWSKTQSVSFSEKAKAKKFFQILCDYDAFKKAPSKAPAATFKVVVLDKSVKELGLITSATSKTSGSMDGFACSLAPVDDCVGLDAQDFCRVCSFFVYSKNRRRFSELRKLKKNGQFIEAYVKVSKDKSMRTLAAHHWQDVLYRNNGDQEAYWLDDVMSVGKYEQIIKPAEKTYVTNVNFRTLKVEPDKKAHYRMKCSIGISDFFCGLFFEKCSDTHYSFWMEDETERFHGYIPKNEKGREIFKVLSRKKKALATVEFHYSFFERLNSCVLIDNVEFGK